MGNEAGALEDFTCKRSKECVAACRVKMVIIQVRSTSTVSAPYVRGSRYWPPNERNVPHLLTCVPNDPSRDQIHVVVIPSVFPSPLFLFFVLFADSPTVHFIVVARHLVNIFYIFSPHIRPIACTLDNQLLHCCSDRVAVIPPLISSLETLTWPVLHFMLSGVRTEPVLLLIEQESEQQLHFRHLGLLRP